jgi:hypothetical protein
MWFTYIVLIAFGIETCSSAECRSLIGVVSDWRFILFLCILRTLLFCVYTHSILQGGGVEGIVYSDPSVAILIATPVRNTYMTDTRHPFIAKI